ncbi:uncharacterized protein LOC142975223 [Anticarsia gemmatalis]|uniref:uncharacterized protein LOC142975223 n=1 Tax=Anticarsia gemmatalis TaxID=129554 RepID=UPI003F765E14
MKAQSHRKLPQEGTTDSGESLTEPSSVRPTYSGGDKLCPKPGGSLDLSGLAEAISSSPEKGKNTTSQWTVAAHKRPCKREPTAPAKSKQRLKELPERRRPNRRARREHLQSKNATQAETATAAAATQRDPQPSTSGELKTAPPAPPPPPPPSKSSKRRTPRGTRGRRNAATAPTAPEKEQSGTGDGPNERASSKRSRLDDTQSPRGEAKRAKTDAKPKRAMSYADANKSHLRVAIITVPPRDLSQSQADQLREAIDDSILQAVLAPPSPSVHAPSFRGRPFLLDGALAMWCEDTNALDWLGKEIGNIASPVPGTTLTVIKQSEMKKKLKAGLLIHTRITEAATLQRVLCAQNPWYKVDSWQCYDMTVDDKPQEVNSKEKIVHLILGIPEDQKQAILDRDRRRNKPRAAADQRRRRSQRRGPHPVPSRPPLLPNRVRARWRQTRRRRTRGLPVTKMTSCVARSPLNINIIQTNLQHKQIAAATLRRALEVNNKTVALIQEPWIRNNKICGLSNICGKLLVKPSVDKPRTCIFMPNTITTTLLNQFCSRDLTAVTIHTENNTTLVLASVYMPSDGETPTRELAELVQHCETQDWELIIAADCNAHHPLWGSKDTNKRDITLATHAAANLIAGWHVSNEPSLADHRRVCFQIQHKQKDPDLYRNPRKTDISRYTNLLTKALSDGPVTDVTLSTNNIDLNVALLTKSMLNSYHSACPTSISKDPGKSSWWGPELERLRKGLRTLFNHAKNTRTTEAWDKYKIAQKHYKKRIRFRRTESWHNFCSNIDSTNQAARIKKILSKGNPNLLGTLKKADGTYTNNDKETCEILLETHFPGCLMTSGLDWSDEHHNTPTTLDWEIANKIVTADRMAWAIKSFQPFKSAGLDMIFPALLQWQKDETIKHLLPIYRACIAFKYIPKLWRKAKVVFLPKPGKEDYTHAKAFRPISLTSFLLKTLERLVDIYLRDGVLKNNPLHPQQHAYRKGKSTESALHKVVHKIESAFTNKASTLASFIDIEGAFDKTMHNSIKHALQRLKVEPVLTGWITELVSKRAVQIVANTTMRAKVVRGCPQGGVLSPLLWNIVVDSLLTSLNKKGYTTIGYADDLAILINGTAENVLCKIMRSAFQIIENWCEEHQLSVNPKKTELILFTNKRKLPDLELPKLFNTKLTLSTQVKYLGMVLDNKLNWASHIEAKTRKACIAFGQCRRMVGNKWGLNPNITLWLYTSVIRPSITYGAVVWWPRTQLTTVKTKLQSTQRLACVATTGCMKTTPSNALEYLLNLRPLDLVIQEEAQAAALRLKANGLWQQNPETTHTKILQCILKEIPLLDAPTDKTPCHHVFDRRYNIQLKEESKDDSGINEVRIYTDGSKTAFGTGAGVFSNDLNIKISATLDKLNTIFQAECIGITKAAQAVAARDVRDFKIKIVSDSASMLQALQNNVITSALVLECHNALQAIARTNTVTLQWIKGHSNSMGNDAADELAKRGSNGTVLGPEPLLPIPQAQIKSWLNRNTEAKHLKEWNNSKGCRQTKAAVPVAPKNLARNLISLKRDKIRKVIGILTGHCPLNKHLCTIGVTDSPLCRGCMEAEETPQHVLVECNSVADQRARTKILTTTLQEACSNLKKLLKFWEELGWLE